MATGTIFCWKCGNVIPATSRFCPICGTAQQPVAVDTESRATLCAVSVAAVIISLVTLLPMLKLNVGFTVELRWLADLVDISFPGMASLLIRLAALPSSVTGHSIGAVELFLAVALIMALPTVAVVRSSIACYRAFCNRPSSVPAALATSLIIFVLMVVISLASRMQLVPTFCCLAGLVASIVFLVFSLASKHFTRESRRARRAVGRG